MCHGKNHVPSDPVFETCEFLVYGVVSPAFFPEVPRVYDRHQDLLTSNPVHLLPYYVLYLLRTLETEWEKGEYSSSELADVSCS